MGKSAFRQWLFPIAVTILVSILYSSCQSYTLTHYQERDILRAQEILNGHFPIWGPETNAGPRLPGPFYAILLAIPLSISGDLTFVPIFLSLFLGISLGISANIIRRHSGYMAAILFVLCFTLFPFSSEQILKNWNPSFAFPLSLLAIVMGISANQKGGIGRWFAWGTILSLGTQVHGSFAAFYAASIWILLNETPKNTRLRDALGFLGGAFWPFIPALVSLYTAPQTENSTSEIIFNYVKSLAQLDSGIAPRALECLVPILFFPIFSKLSTEKTEQRKQAILVAAAMAASQAPAALIFITSGYAARYAICFFVSFSLLVALISPVKKLNVRLFLVFFFGALLCLLRTQKPLGLIYLPALEGNIGLLLSLAALAVTIWIERNKTLILALAIFVVLPYCPFPTRQGDKYPNIEELQEITSAIANRTGWTYEEFRWRTVAVQINDQVGFELPYRKAIGQAATSAESPSGIFLIFRKATGTDPVASARRALEKARDNADYATLFKKIRTDDGFCTSGGRLCFLPYFLGARNHGDLRQNLGVTFLGEKMLLEAELHLAKVSSEEIIPLGPSSILFTWNECGSKNPNCRNGIALQLERKKNEVEVTATIAGHSLGVSNDRISPDWSEYWTNPFAEFTCNKIKQRVVLAHSIGVRFDEQPHGLLAPFRTTFPISCPPGRLTELSAGREESSVRVGKTNPKKLSPTSPQLSWKLAKPL